MKQAQFYVLNKDNIHEQACDLAAKAWRLGKRNAQRRDLLISLQTQIPEFVTSFNQVIEFVPVDETEKAQARERYKQYRQQGWQLLTEQIS